MSTITSNSMGAAGDGGGGGGTRDDLEVQRRLRVPGKSRVTSMLQRMSWCGCTGPGDSRIPSRPKSPAAALSGSCAWIVPPEPEPPEPALQQDLGQRFDLSDIRFIDEDDDDEEAAGTVVEPYSRDYGTHQALAVCDALRVLSRLTAINPLLAFRWFAMD